MTAIFIAVFVVLIVMIYFMTVSIQIVVEHATKKVNAYFASKLNEFDEDFGGKIEKLNELEEEKNKLKQDIKALEVDRTNLKESRFYKPRPIIRDIYIPTARYIDNEFFEDYKMVKNILIIEKEEMIKKVMEATPYSGDIERYRLAKGISDKLNFEALYDVSTLEAEKQLLGLDEILSEEELELLKEYIESLVDWTEFDVLDFVRFVNFVRDEESPILTACVGEQGLDFSHISPDIEVIFDDNICEGIRIIYQHRVFDYSVYQSRKRSEGGF